MQRTGATKTHQSKIARVVTLLDRHQSQRTKHGFVNDLDDALRRRHKIDTHGVSDTLNCSNRCISIDLHIATELHIRGQITENHVCITYGWGIATLHVTGRTRHCTRGLRAHAQCFR